MESLIKPTKQNGKIVVSARHLYEFLQVRTDFTNWCKRMFEYGFTEGVDYTLAKIGEPSVHNKTDYALTIECAKEISMLQRSEKGKEARQYFIECEKKLLHPSEDELILKTVNILQSRVEAYKQELEQMKSVVLSQAPKVALVDNVLQSPDLIPTSIIAKDLGMSAKKLNQVLNEKKIIYRLNGIWVPYSKYQDKGYMKTKTYTWHDSTGGLHTNMQMYWTERGRAFINALFGNVPFKSNMPAQYTTAIN